MNPKRIAVVVALLGFASSAALAQTPAAPPPAAPPATTAPAATGEPAAPAPTPAAPKIEGKYRFVGGDAEQKALDAAIEVSIADMMFIKRPIARGRLKDRNKIPTAWVFTTSGGQIKANAEGIMAWSSPESGAPADVKTSTGDDAKLTQKITDNKLLQTFATKEGKRDAVFTLSPDGTTLTCAVTLVSEQLPKPLKYTLTFKK